MQRVYLDRIDPERVEFLPCERTVKAKALRKALSRSQLESAIQIAVGISRRWRRLRGHNAEGEKSHADVPHRCSSTTDKGALMRTDSHLKAPYGEFGL